MGRVRTARSARAWTGERNSAAIRALLAAVLALGGLVASGAAWGGVAHADSGGTLTITQPHPSSNTATGPVGANVAVQGQGTAGVSYTLGYQTQDLGCAAGSSPLASPPVTVTAASDGSFAAQFSWPSAASAVGTNYVICATTSSKPSAPPIASQVVYHVASASPPQIRLAGVTAGSGGAVVLPAGGSVKISGANFNGNGVRVTAYLSLVQVNSAGALQSNGTVLQTADGKQRIDVGGDGTFSATYIIPNIQSAGSFLYVVSNDGSATLLPTLVAMQQVTVGQAATPTATPAPTSTAAPTTQPSPTSTPPGTGGGDSFSARLPLIVALGILSVLLFVLGLILLATAASGPRNPQSR